MYDLHGMVNHYGTLGFGHYVSYTKNHFDQKWYRYDDLSREEVSEDQLHKASAYLLFYVRKDIETKQFEQIMPNIEREYFAGKPVKIDQKDGFVVENQTSSATKKIMIKLKTNPMRSTVSTDDLQPEEDKNEIEYRAGELKVIQRMNRLQT